MKQRLNLDASTKDESVQQVVNINTTPPNTPVQGPSKPLAFPSFETIRSWTLGILISGTAIAVFIERCARQAPTPSVIPSASVIVFVAPSASTPLPMQTPVTTPVPTSQPPVMKTHVFPQKQSEKVTEKQPSTVVSITVAPVMSQNQTTTVAPTPSPTTQPVEPGSGL